MIRALRWRSRMAAALPAALAACSSHVPNTTLSPKTEYGRAIDDLFDILLIGGLTVLVLVFIALAFVVVNIATARARPSRKRFMATPSSRSSGR